MTISSKTLLLIIFISALCSCTKEKTAGDLYDLNLDTTAGQIGIAVITPDGDTMTVNNSADYPLMSVFKLHEALAVADALAAQSQTFDSILHIDRGDLSTDTWSPMLKDYPSGDIEISAGDLVKYSLLESDNNASNLLFERIATVEQTDSFVRSLDGMPQDFEIKYTERQMQADHPKAYHNRTSPLACAILINKTLNETLTDRAMQDSIVMWLGNCQSALGRMAAAVAQFPDTRLYHRTGSGYTNENGEIAAVNDVGVIVFPDGRKLTVAVLIKDFAGAQAQADSVIAAVTTQIISRFADRDEN